jgi:hypothetical protein
MRIMTKNLALRYIAAGIIAFMTALVVGLIYEIVIGDLKGQVPAALKRDSDLSFLAVLAGGFCFPPLSRWLRSAFLLVIGLTFYCVLWAVESEPTPFHVFFALIYGGIGAVFLHGFIDLIRLIIRRKSTATTSARIAATSR